MPRLRINVYGQDALYVYTYKYVQKIQTIKYTPIVLAKCGLVQRIHVMRVCVCVSQVGE